jgi:hypothetical protein
LDREEQEQEEREMTLENTQKLDGIRGAIELQRLYERWGNIKTAQHRTGKKKVYYHLTPDSFLKTLKEKRVRLPIYRITFRPSESRSGEIYYVARTSKKSDTIRSEESEQIHVFRGTFGYFGAGPGFSALIDSFFDSRNWKIEKRDGDANCLLAALGVHTN